MTNTEDDAVARRYEAVFDNPMTFIGLLEPDGTVLDANRTALEFTEASATAVTGRKFWNTPWWEESESLQSDLREWVERAADGEYVRYEADHPRGNGDAATVDGVIHPVRDDDGDVAELLAVARDVSDRRDREETLTALHDLAVDLEGGRNREEVCQRTVDGAHRVLDFDLCVINLEEDRRLPVVALSESLPEGGVTTMTVDEGVAGKTYRTGESMLIDEVSTVEAANPQGPYRSAISVPIGDHGVFQVVERDVGAFDESDLELAELLASHTAAALDRLARERQLERENERLEEFVSVLSHDLRNPLNVLSGAIERAEATGDADAFEDCRWAVDRMEGLIEDLLTLAREGRVVDEPDDVDLAEMADACWRGVETSEMALSVETDLVVRADRDRLQQLLENLFANAVEHGSTSRRTASDDAVERGGETVSIGPLEGGFYVEDDGPGLPPDAADQVLEAGYSTASDGIGLGLSIVRRIAEAHGWSLALAESDAGGARFEFTGVDVVT